MKQSILDDALNLMLLSIMGKKGVVKVVSSIINSEPFIMNHDNVNDRLGIVMWAPKFVKRSLSLSLRQQKKHWLVSCNLPTCTIFR